MLSLEQGNEFGFKFEIGGQHQHLATMISPGLSIRRSVLRSQQLPAVTRASGGSGAKP